MFLLSLLSVLLCFLLVFANKQIVQSYKIAYQDLDLSPLSAEFIASLNARDELELEVFEALEQSPASERQRLLLNGTYDYCLLIPEGFGESLHQGRFAGLLEVYRLEGSSAKSWVDEQLSLNLFDLWGSSYTESLLAEHGLHFSRTDLEKERQSLNTRTLVRLQESGAERDQSEAPQEKSLSLPLLIALAWFFLLLIITLHWASNLQEVYADDVQQRLKIHGCSSTAYYLTQFSVLFLRLLFLSFCFFVLSLLLPLFLNGLLPGQAFKVNLFDVLFQRGLRPSLLYLMTLIPLFFSTLIKEKQISAMLRLLILALAIPVFVLW